MKSILLLFTAAILSFPVLAQRTIPLRNLWAKPQVHVFFGEYQVSFTIKDIDKALQLLAETGDNTYGDSSGLDPKKEYVLKLQPDLRLAYDSHMQPMIQKGVGCFLLTAGHAEIKRKRKKLKEIILDISVPTVEETDVTITATDPHNKKMIFKGRMKIDMYNKDLGID